MLRRHTVRWMGSSALAALLFLLVAPPVSAAPQTPASDEVPARLSFFDGTVTVQRAAAGETEGALVNLPLDSGDRIWSADDGRVEIDLEDGTTLWLDTNTTLDFVSLPREAGRGGAILRLWGGSLFVERPVIQHAAPPLRIDGAAGSATFDRAGLFRVDIDDEQRLWLSSYDGVAVLTAGGLAESVAAGNRSFAELDTAPARAADFNTADDDPFGRWRDERVALYASSRQYVRDRDYVPRTIVHYAADLEPYGSWGYADDVGSWYWRPTAAIYWTPYRDGRWVYTYRGWCWVPAAPWGWVTTHYGRWHHSGSYGWIWFPSRSWSPASVSWYVGPRHVGWVPLNYYGAPAVSFGAHFGGHGFGLDIGYYPYSYYGYPFSYYRYPRYYGYAGYWGGGRHDRHDRFDNDRGRRSTQVGPIGSASGRGRVVNGLGYSSGLAEAWTVVDANQFESHNVGRVALARSALPQGLDQSSKALLSGPLRARRPAALVPAAGSRIPLGQRSAAGEPRAATGGATRRAVPRGVTGRSEGLGTGSAPSVQPNAAGGSTAPGARPTTGTRSAVTRGGQPTTAPSQATPSTGRRAIRSNETAPRPTGLDPSRGPSRAKQQAAPPASSSSAPARRATPRKPTATGGGSSGAGGSNVSGAIPRALASPVVTSPGSGSSRVIRAPSTRPTRTPTGSSSPVRRALQRPGGSQQPTGSSVRPTTSGRPPSGSSVRPPARPAAGSAPKPAASGGTARPRPAGGNAGGKPAGKPGGARPTAKPRGGSQ